LLLWTVTTMLLRVESVDVFYGVIQALHGVTLEVDKGEIVTLIGANGAGKYDDPLDDFRVAPPDAGAHPL